MTVLDSNQTFNSEDFSEGARCDVCSAEFRDGDDLFFREIADGYQVPVCGSCENRRRVPRSVEVRDEESLRILSEPLTYAAQLRKDTSRYGHRGFRAIQAERNVSYFRDLAIHTQKAAGYEAAERRLRRHAKEMAVIGATRSRSFAPGATYGTEQEQRTVSWTSGQGGYFAPPLWIVEQFAEVPTPERVWSSRMPSFELPEGVQSVNIPAWTSGGEMGVTALNNPAVNTTLVDTSVSSAVATIAGTLDIPMQMLEQSPQGAHFDWVTFSNMEARYGYQLELQLYVGQGASNPQGSGNNQLLGIMNNTAIPSGNIITYTDATPTVERMIQTSASTDGGVLPQAIAAIGNRRKVRPEMWAATTSRSVWIASGALEFPIALSDQEEPGTYDLLTYPVYPTDAIPTTLGAGANQDIIVASRPSDWLLLESEPRTNVYMEVLSGSLMVRLQMRRYVAAILRQPTSVSYVTGTGMVVQSGF